MRLRLTIDDAQLAKAREYAGNDIPLDDLLNEALRVLIDRAKRDEQSSQQKIRPKLPPRRRKNS